MFSIARQLLASSYGLYLYSCESCGMLASGRACTCSSAGRWRGCCSHTRCHTCSHTSHILQNILHFHNIHRPIHYFPQSLFAALPVLRCRTCSFTSCDGQFCYLSVVACDPQICPNLCGLLQSYFNRSEVTPTSDLCHHSTKGKCSSTYVLREIACNPAGRGGLWTSLNCSRRVTTTPGQGHLGAKVGLLCLQTCVSVTFRNNKALHFVGMHTPHKGQNYYHMYMCTHVLFVV